MWMSLVAPVKRFRDQTPTNTLIALHLQFRHPLTNMSGSAPAINIIKIGYTDSGHRLSSRVNGDVSDVGELCSGCISSERSLVLALNMSQNCVKVISKR